MEQKSTKRLTIKTDWMRDKDRVDEGAAADMKWLLRHIDGMNVRMTALAGMDAAYLFNKNNKKIQQIAKQIKTVTDELKTAVIEEMADEKMRARSR